jgi:hypothetical protein
MHAVPVCTYVILRTACISRSRVRVDAVYAVRTLMDLLCSHGLHAYMQRSCDF